VSDRIELGRKVAPGPLGAELRSEFTYSVIAVPRAAAKAPVTAKAPPAPADKRAGPRLRTRLREGQLTDKRRKIIVDCLIQDRSETGARLKLAQDKVLPKMFILWSEAGQIQIGAELAWQTGREAGIKFVKIHP
jgi:hypothetical protein